MMNNSSVFLATTRRHQRKKPSSFPLSPMMTSSSISTVQQTMLKGITRHLFFQMCLLLFIVFIGHRYFPSSYCLFTCQPAWIGIILYFVLAILLLLGSLGIFFPKPSNPFHIFMRTLCFYGIGVLLSYVMLLTYNITMKETKTEKEKQWTQTAFYIAMGITVLFFGLLVVFLPFLIKHLKLLGILTGIFFFVLLVMIIMIVFVNVDKNQKLWTFYLIVSLIIFVVFSMYDLANVISKCKKSDTIECRSEVGATSIYIDLINVFQKLFLLLSNQH
uniref:Uncharacterized protein n=1 Tax=viral metagenome TaxID=1070528 RepID=A0A6C0D296_9ZZZZ